jgi:hypothetical protein
MPDEIDLALQALTGPGRRPDQADELPAKAGLYAIHGGSATGMT